MEVQEIAEEVAKAPSRAADTTTGAVATAFEAASNPTRTARRLQRQGSQINQRMATRVDRAAQQAIETARAIGSGSMPERWLVGGLRLVRRQARRPDLLGLAAHRYLEVVHGSLEVAVRSLTRLERASQPPARRRAAVTRSTESRRSTGPARATRRPAAPSRTAGPRRARTQLRRAS